MTIEKRLERLEKEYFPDAEQHGFLLHEIGFMCAYADRQKRGEPTPAFLEQAYQRLKERWHRHQAHLKEMESKPDLDASESAGPMEKLTLRD